MKMFNVFVFICMGLILVGCDRYKDPELSRLNLVSEDAKTTQIYKTDNPICEYVVRKDDGSIWMYKVSSSGNAQEYFIAGKAMIFNPLK